MELKTFLTQVRRVPRFDSLLKAIGETVVSRTVERINKEIEPDGKKFKELRPYTLAQRRKNGRGAKILQDIGNLMGSINYRPLDKGVIIGVGVSYSVYHQSKEPRTRLPRRPILDTDSEDKEEDAMIDDTIQEWLDLVAREVLLVV